MNRPLRPLRPLSLALVFGLGVAAGLAAAKKPQIGPSTFRGVEPAAAAANLLAAARELAGDGSWENLAVARVHYLSGQKAEGQAIVDRVAAGKTKASDLVRMARIYAEAGEWERAKPLYEQVVALEPKDEDWLAEAGARFLLAGERERGEELLAASFAEDPTNLYNALRAASGYLGVEAMP